MIDCRYNSDTEVLTFKFKEARLDASVITQIQKTIADKLTDMADKLDGMKIVFDLEKVDYLSSLFLRIVVMTAKKVKKGNFSITNTNQFIRNLIKLTGFEQWLDQSSEIICSMSESRRFSPASSFADNARIKSMEEYYRLYQASLDNPDKFWAEQAREHLVWDKTWDKVFEWELPYAKWFTGGLLNASYNCLDKHLDSPTADKTAIIWQGEPTDEEPRYITYRELHKMVSRFANVLKHNGIRKGDRVLIYMPMIPEAAVAMLACARLGAVHSVVFAGFSALAIAERVEDCQAKMIITADGSYRRGKVVKLKDSVDEAMTLKNDDGSTKCVTIEKIIVYQRTNIDIAFDENHDLWWHDEIAGVQDHCPAESVDSEHDLFILYTSGSTGKPKGILHSTAGYMLGTKLTHYYIFDIKEDDIFWCTADIGWITGHSYVVYGPLANGATVLMYEGAPNFPDCGRFWSIIEKFGVTIFYTAPTAIRAFMQWGDEWPQKYDLSSLRLLGTVGEPINPQAWIWYHELIGNNKCPIVDTWWQTETGAIMISAFPGAVTTKPGSATIPFFGIHPEIVDSDGNVVPANSGGTMVVRRPWPSMLRGIWGDPNRYQSTYWDDIPGSYSTGDGARKDEDGFFWIVGRIDDVINVSGHRIGTAEVESALVSNPNVAEAAVVGRADDVKGSVIAAFVTLVTGATSSEELMADLKSYVGNELGAIARPEEIRFVEALPKTRSGKIMRRLLKQLAAGTEITGDTTTLEDFTVLAKLSEKDGA